MRGWLGRMSCLSCALALPRLTRLASRPSPSKRRPGAAGAGAAAQLPRQPAPAGRRAQPVLDPHRLLCAAARPALPLVAGGRHCLGAGRGWRRRRAAALPPALRPLAGAPSPRGLCCSISIAACCCLLSPPVLNSAWCLKNYCKPRRPRAASAGAPQVPECSLRLAGAVPGKRRARVAVKRAMRNRTPSALWRRPMQGTAPPLLARSSQH